jgi:PAS domain S-box-containing protein
MTEAATKRLEKLTPALEKLLFPGQRSFASKTIITLIAVEIAFLVRQLIGPPDLNLPFLTFFPAAAISAVFGGFWAGMAAAVLGSALASYFYIPPYAAFSFEFKYETVFGNLVYLLDEVIVCSAIAALHRFYRISKDQTTELTTLVETIPDLVWVRNRQGVHLECNSAIERLYGVSRDSVIGRACTEFLPVAEAEAIRLQDQATLAAGKAQVGEGWITRKDDGRRLYVESITTPMHVAGDQFIGVLGITRDITSRRTLEEEVRANLVELERGRAFLAAVLEHTGDAILAVDDHDMIALANQEARRLLGTGADGSHQSATQFSPEWPEIAKHVIDHGEARRELEMRGRRLALSVTRTGVSETQFVIVARDVSEERRLAEERRELDRQMFQMEKLATLGELAMGLAHEIGNPLAGMKAVTQSLQYVENLPASVREPLRRLESEIDRLTTFLRSFHGFAAPQPPNPVSCRLHEVIDDVLFWTRKEAVLQNVSVVLNMSPQLTVLAEPTQIKQALLNLVINAMHAMPDGGVLKISAELEETDSVHIDIADTGVGIDPKVLPRIFDPFFTTRPSGSGLGLAVVKKIVADHRALINVESRQGHGTCFSLSWPVK